MNPARSFGPAVFGGTLDTYWLYAIGPLVGASLAVVFYFRNAGSAEF